MVGGLSTLLEQQAAETGLLTIDMVSFDDQIEYAHSLALPSAVTVELDPRGSTALYDAIGIGVHGFGKVLAAMPEHARPDTVQVIVVTDGQENASREYAAASVRALVAKQTETYNWNFVFLGANQDAVLTGAELGFDADSSLTFAAAPEQVMAMNDSLGRYVTDAQEDEARIHRRRALGIRWEVADDASTEASVPTLPTGWELYRKDQPWSNTPGRSRTSCLKYTSTSRKTK